MLCSISGWTLLLLLRWGVLDPHTDVATALGEPGCGPSFFAKVRAHVLAGHLPDLWRNLLIQLDRHKESVVVLVYGGLLSPMLVSGTAKRFPHAAHSSVGVLGWLGRVH